MNPKIALKWLEADQYCKTHPVPAILAKEASKRAGVAMRKARAARPAIRLPRGQKKEALPKLKKELDRVFSIFIRRRDSDGNGIGRCVTCGYYGRWQDMDAGHYIPRQDLAVRWDERNVHIQCKSCNGFRGGELVEMAEYIHKKYGLLTAIALRTVSKEKFRLDRQWLEEKINHYKSINQGES